MRLVKNCGDDVVEVGYQAMIEADALSDRVTFTVEQFKEGCKDLDIWGFFDDKPVGMLILDGKKIHLTILKEYQGKCDLVILKAFRDALNVYGELIAEVHFKNDKALKFVKRLGFSFTGKQDDLMIYRCKL